MPIRIAFLLLAVVVIGCGRETPASAPQVATAANSVVAYFTGAEIQAETDAQRAELRRALGDMLALSAADLQSRRYADYAGNKDVRSLAELLTAHVVPSAPESMVSAQFFADIKAPAAQVAIRKVLDELERSASAGTKVPIVGR